MMRLKRAGTKRTRGQTLTLKVMEYTVYNKMYLIRVLGETILLADKQQVSMIA